MAGGLSEEDWEAFLNNPEDVSIDTAITQMPPTQQDTTNMEVESSAGQTEDSVSPFAVGKDNPVDPLIFVQSEEAPELRAAPRLTPVVEEKTPTEPVDKPYFMEESEEVTPWVPKQQTSNDELSAKSSTMNAYLGVALRIILFAVPLIVIAVTFSIALSFE